MKKIHIISLVVLLFVSGYIFYHNYFSDNASNPIVTVIINDQGFFPDRVVVHQGTTIAWVNQGEHLHWPASNFHPTHTLYPEPGGCIGSLFDACRGLQKGETFSFQLDKMGIWPIHDHLFPGIIMVLEVVDKNVSLGAKLPSKSSFGSLAPKLVAEFRSLNYDQQLEIIKSVATNDPTKAWAYLKDNFVVNGEVSGNAHEFSHIIGNKAFEKFGIEGIKICDPTFAFGCFHGVTEMMLLSEGLTSIKIIENGCLKIFPPDKSQNYTSCIHGTGHGVYSFEGGKLKNALADCDIISEPNRQYCYDGVFMENVSAPEAKIFDAQNPWKFCTGLDERYHRNCARYQSQIFLGGGDGANSIEQVGKNCAKGPSVLLRETCFESLGYYIAENSLGEVADILGGCKRMPSIEAMEICVNGAATESIFQKYAGFENSANKLCQSLTEPRRSICLLNIRRMIK